MSILLKLTDLHSENVGLVISKNGGSVKAKFAVIDLKIDCNKKVNFSFFTDSVSVFVNNHILNSGLSTEKYLLSFSKNLNDDDYIQAFKKIEENFSIGYRNDKEQNHEILEKLISFSSFNDYQKRKLENMKEVYSHIWCENFSILQQKITALRKESFTPFNI